MLHSPESDMHNAQVSVSENLHNAWARFRITSFINFVPDPLELFWGSPRAIRTKDLIDTGSAQWETPGDYPVHREQQG